MKTEGIIAFSPTVKPWISSKYEPMALEKSERKEKED